jgi:hypothetical protein
MTNQEKKWRSTEFYDAASLSEETKEQIAALEKEYDALLEEIHSLKEGSAEDQAVTKKLKKVGDKIVHLKGFDKNDREPIEENTEQVYQKEGLYTAEDFSHWKDGSEKYEDFSKGIKDINQYFPDDIAAIQLMFLGEKPAVITNYLAFDHKDSLEKYGFKFLGSDKFDGFCFRPDLVKATIEKYKNDVHFPTENPEELLKYIIERNQKPKEIVNDGDYDVSSIMGLIFGFPLSSVLKYREMSKLNWVHKSINSLYDLLPEDGKKFIEKTWRGGKIPEGQKKPDNQEILNWTINKFVEYQDVLGFDKEKLAAAADALKIFLDVKFSHVDGMAWADYYGTSADSTLKQQRLATALETGFKKTGTLVDKQV